MRSTIDAFNRRDLDALRTLFDPDAEITPVRAAIDGTVFRGPEAPAQYCAAIDESWERLGWEIEGFRDDADWVLALGHIRGAGRGSGAKVDARAGWLARFSRGRVKSFRTYSERAQAFADLGLEE
jgi:ketosteroid isomerase-like protein